MKYVIGLGLIGMGVRHIYENQKAVRGLQFHSQENQRFDMFLNENLQLIQNQQEKGVIGRIQHKVGLIIRFLELGLYYLPLMLVLPLFWWNPVKYEDLMLDWLAFGIRQSGSVIIKLAQYGSHRPDIFNEKFINKFAHLRVDAPQHSYQETIQILKENKLLEKLGGLEKKPIASGVIGQVYAAEYEGEKVAVKVRHPRVMEKIKQDLQLVFGITSWLAQLSSFTHFQMPLTINDFMKVLIDQTDFRLECAHLQSFNRNFANMKDLVDFPKDIYSSQDVLIETFVHKGLTITDFMKEGRIGQNKKLAKLGVNCIYKMVIYDNFVHADCHGGNIFVQKIENDGQGKQNTWMNKLNRIVFKMVNRVHLGLFNGWLMLNNQMKEGEQGDSGLERLQKDYQELLVGDESDDYDFQDEEEQYRLVLLDTGMVTHLNRQNHVDLLHLLKSVVVKDQRQCCRAIRSMAINAQPEQLTEFEATMFPTFKKLKDTPLHQVNIGQIVQDIIFSAQKCNIKFEGHMATLLQNLVVLEGLARQLDPQINIIGQAIPFLLSPDVIQKLILE